MIEMCHAVIRAFVVVSFAAGRENYELQTDRRAASQHSPVVTGPIPQKTSIFPG